MKVSDCMTTHVVTANRRDGLRQTWERMNERQIRHMPVLGDDGQMVGIVSERDLRRPDFVDTPNVAHFFALDNRATVEQAMHVAVTIRPDDDVRTALDAFVERKFGALPVLDDGGTLVGMISIIDLLRAFRDHLGG